MVMLRHQYHPVRDYLDELEWDGVERVGRLFIDYLGADDTEYVREVTRKMLVAAVARVFNPGVKFDHMLVLVGRQGIGKSYILNLLGREWYSDTLDTVQGKEAYEQLHGVWVMEMGELTATKKADIEAIKHFITKQEDNYRVACGRHTRSFPRQCVFFGTTNDTEFLRDRTGNRRFWPVTVGRNPIIKDMWAELTKSEIDQVWAEAVTAYQNKEALYLDTEMSLIAAEIQEEHVEESSKTGMIKEYLDILLPENWSDLDIHERRNY